MSANHLHPRSIRAHVFDVTLVRATHVSDSARVDASPPTLRYTLAGFPPGNLRAGRSAR